MIVNMQPGPECSWEEKISWGARVVEFWKNSLPQYTCYAKYNDKTRVFDILVYMIVNDSNHRLDFEVDPERLWNSPIAELALLTKRIDSEEAYLALGGYSIHPNYSRVDERIFKKNIAFREKFVK
jgi:hypothetical protein